MNREKENIESLKSLNVLLKHKNKALISERCEILEKNKKLRRDYEKIVLKNETLKRKNSLLEFKTTFLEIKVLILNFFEKQQQQLDNCSSSTCGKARVDSRADSNNDNE